MAPALRNLKSYLGLSTYAAWLEISFCGPNPKNSEIMELTLSFIREIVVECPPQTSIGLQPSYVLDG